MIKEPIILAGDGGGQVFRRKEEAERYTEPIDIHNGEYVAYDATGKLLTLSVPSGGYHGVLSMPEDVLDRSNELSDVLRELLRAISRAQEVSFDPESLDQMSLRDLVELALEHDT